MKLYVEASLCNFTGVAGWGAVLARSADPDQWSLFHGLAEASCGRFTVLAELAAAQSAVQAARGPPLLTSPATIAMRSSAALAVLRWVFPDAPFMGNIYVHRPKALKTVVQDFAPLYALSDLIEAANIQLSLEHISGGPQSELAANLARSEMEMGRRAVQRQQA